MYILKKYKPRRITPELYRETKLQIAATPRSKASVARNLHMSKSTVRKIAASKGYEDYVLSSLGKDYETPVYARRLALALFNMHTDNDVSEYFYEPELELLSTKLIDFSRALLIAGIQGTKRLKKEIIK